MPSVWAEARSRIVVEAMSRGVPVIASDIGGLGEAHLGVDYLIPITPITHYKPQARHEHGSRVRTCRRKTSIHGNRLSADCSAISEHYEEISAKSREAALEYARSLNVLPFEGFLEDVRHAA